MHCFWVFYPVNILLYWFSFVFFLMWGCMTEGNTVRSPPRDTYSIDNRVVFPFFWLRSCNVSKEYRLFACLPTYWVYRITVGSSERWFDLGSLFWVKAARLHHSLVGSSGTADIHDTVMGKRGWWVIAIRRERRGWRYGPQ